MQLSVSIEAPPRSVTLSRPGSVRRVAVRLVLCVLVGALTLLGGQRSTELRIRQLSGPYEFQLLEWELQQIGRRLDRIGAGLLGVTPAPEAADRHAFAAYLAAPAADRAALRPAAEAAIERSLTQVATAEGLTAPLPLAPDGSVVFPPVSFSLVPPPKVLVVSPRDRIAVSQSELLRPDMTILDAEALEGLVDREGVSSLVVPIGGLATYPAMVLEGDRPLDTVVAVAHEWIHGYLFFHPLGREYWSSPAARSINETATEMASRELGRRAAAELGVGPAGRPRPNATAGDSSGSAGDNFRSTLRSIRVEVDALLAAGRVEEAEAYMRDRRHELTALGHDVRKLNQAYFAFYGSYGDAAAGRSPIPGQLQRLRESSGSVGEFLRRVGQLRGSADLARAVGDA
jgi:hypothetical protein